MAYYSQGSAPNSHGYPMTNPAYNGSTQEKYRMQPESTGVSMPESQRRSSATKWSWCSSGWAIFATFCCCSWCGVMGLLCSVWSYVDHKSEDHSRSRYKNKWAWACTVVGIIIGLVIIAGIIVALVAFKDEICEDYVKNKDNWGNVNLNDYCFDL